MAQIYLAQRQAYAFSQATELAGHHLMDNTLTSVNFILNYSQLSALPPAPILPMEDMVHDWAWADETAACVVVWQQSTKERLYVVLNWRHPTGSVRIPANSTANNIARVHYTTPMIDHVVTMDMTSTPGFRGLYQATYGNYALAMNASPGTSYTVTIPQSSTTTTLDLIARKRYIPGHPYPLAPQATVVWYIG
jgi:hypothetical protein